VTDREVIEAAALGSSVRAIGGRTELVGGAVCAQHPALPNPEVNRAIPLEPRVDLAAVSGWYDGAPHVVVAPPDHPELIEALPRVGYEPARAFTETGAATTEGPGPSYRNILRGGFRESYLRPNWQSA
jgi:hypothetical protein